MASNDNVDVSELLDEFASPVTPGRGRKRIKEWQKTKDKSTKYKKIDKVPILSCQHRNGQCRAGDLVSKDLQGWSFLILVDLLLDSSQIVIVIVI